MSIKLKMEFNTMTEINTGLPAAQQGITWKNTQNGPILIDQKPYFDPKGIQLSEQPKTDALQLVTKTEEAKSGKHVFPAMASFFIPGSGQMINGETKKGLKQLAANVGLIMLSRTKGILALPAFIGAFALNVYSAVDAYRSKSK